ncbi:MAG: hypothetical protein HQL46_16305 [Gammaproteobacteria bacterium]|nr:hypothetical protein [Gammaproteobacteria bacterium]
MSNDKIHIDSQYLKLSPIIMMHLEKYKRNVELDLDNSKFYMVGNDIEVHFNNGTCIKLGDVYWIPRYSS